MVLKKLGSYLGKNDDPYLIRYVQYKCKCYHRGKCKNVKHENTSDSGKILLLCKIHKRKN